MKSLALALVFAAGAAHADARIAHGNDAFSEVVPPLDDLDSLVDPVGPRQQALIAEEQMPAEEPGIGDDATDGDDPPEIEARQVEVEFPRAAA